MSDTQEAERIQMRMQRVRRRMETGVDGLLSDAQQLMDWQYYVARHPLACALGAALAGFLLVPGKRTVTESKVYLDPLATEKFLNTEAGRKVGLEEAATEAPVKAGLAFTLGTFALNYATKYGVNLASEYLRNTLLKEFASMGDPRKQSSSENVQSKN